ncbi:hypothetical protein [Haloactinomyces albus]|uniref:Uncharacterized protein n=1 Tax=Haloactinomyces albus TaxID=1352928 RepID=A0AAE4CSA9_9ACTN|nr:hypothetical protein [Haloactinomyces albus]MDR7304498.1 hypothetical protein [Haloactinomyces albus]
MRAVQAALFTHAALLLTWHQSSELPTAHQLPGTLTSHRHRDWLEAVAEPVWAVANLLWDHLDLTAETLLALRRDQLVIDDVTHSHHGPITAPAVILNQLVLSLPDWSLPLLRTYRCPRDHARTTPASDALLCLDSQPISQQTLVATMTGRDPVALNTFHPRETTHHHPRIHPLNNRLAPFPNTWTSPRGLYLHHRPLNHEPLTPRNTPAPS